MWSCLGNKVQAHLGTEERRTKKLSNSGGCIYLELASEGSSRNTDNTISIVASSSSTGVREGPLELSHGDGTIALAGDMAHVCGRRRSSTGSNRCGRTTFLRELDNVIVATTTGGSLVRRVLVMFMMGSDS